MDRKKIIKELQDASKFIAEKNETEQAKSHIKALDEIVIFLKKQEVKTGRWVAPEDEGNVIFSPEVYVQCSECGKKAQYGHKDKYCRNCGAKMEGQC